MKIQAGKRRSEKIIKDDSSRDCKPHRSLKFENGRTYYSKRMERKILFMLTLIMLFAGVMVKMGLF